MRITDLTVDGFGVWSGLELADLSDQLNVFYGPNEAGKTTLMQFVRSMLYGFSAERRGRYLPPVHAGRPGGTLHTVAGQQAFTISRHADSLDGGEAACVSDGQQTVRDDRAVSALLGDVDETIFNNVFAIGLREIQELGTLSDSQASEQLYSLALGLDRVSLFDVLNELETSRNRLLASDDRPSLIVQLLSQRERLRSEIDDLGQGTMRFLSLDAERQRLDQEIAGLEADAARLEKQDRELALARALSERWRRREAIDEQLKNQGPALALPADALSKFEHLQTRIKVRRDGLTKLKRARRDMSRQIHALAINEALCRLSPRLEALAEQQPWLESLAGQIARLELELAELESHREQGGKQLGMEGRAGLQPISRRGLEELRNAGRALRNAKNELRPLGEQITAADQLAEQSERKLKGGLASAPQQNLTPALAEAGELVSLLRKRVQIDGKLDQMSRRQAELEEQGGRHLENQVLPTWALAGLGSLFVLGCAMLLLFIAGLVLPASLTGAVGWPVGFLGILAAGGAAAGKYMMEQRASGQLDTCHDQIHSLNQQIKEAQAERDELDEQLPRGGGPLVSRLQAAEKALAKLEALMPLEAERETAQREAQAARARAEALRQQSRQLHKTWQRLLAANGLPQNLSPRQLKGVAQQRRKLEGVGQSIQDVRAELTRRRTEFETVAARIRGLAGDIGMSAFEAKPLDLLRTCLVELSGQQTRLTRRDELKKQLVRLRARQQSLTRRIAKLIDRRRAMLRLAGTTEVGEFRSRAAAQAENERLVAERERLARDIAATLTGHIAEEQLAAMLVSDEQLEKLAADLTEARRLASLALNGALARRGELGLQRKLLIEDRQLPHKRMELDVVEKRLQDALARWRVLAICGLMLSAVREYFEREHQPQVLRDASGYMKRLTSGRYTRVWTPLGEQSLRVDDAEGETLRVEVLSRGTREQLFLALRLALVSAYAERGVNLPLVLDDVLVNFDLARAKSAATVLRDFAKQDHQILVFTCHEHIAKLFKNIKAEVRQLPDNAQPQGESQIGKRTRRRVEAQPEEEPQTEPQVEPDFAPVAEEPPPQEIVVEVTPLVESFVEPVVEVVMASVLEPIVELQAEIEPPPAPLPVAPPVAPPPARQPRRPAEPRGPRWRWSAEEFDGELEDRVRHSA